MAGRRKSDSADGVRDVRTAVGPSALAGLRPDLSRRGLIRLGARIGLACGCIGGLAMLAGWSVRGVLDRGGLERLISMKNSPAGVAPDPIKRGALDRGRLKALVQADGKARSP